MNSTNKILFILLLAFNFTFSQEWIETAITENITIDFPVKSQKDFDQGQIVYSSIDDNAVYLVTILKVSGSQSPSNLKEFYEGNIEGALSASGGILVSKQDIVSNTITGVDIEYDTPPHPQLPQKRFKRILFIKPNLINLEFMVLSKKLNASQLKELRTKFFKSLKIREDAVMDVEAVNESEDMDNYSDNKAFELGFLFGKIMFFVFLIGALIGLVFLIRSLRKKRKTIRVSENNESIKSNPVEVTCAKCKAPNVSSSKYCNKCGYKL